MLVVMQIACKYVESGAVDASVIFSTASEQESSFRAVADAGEKNVEW